MNPEDRIKNLLDDAREDGEISYKVHKALVLLLKYLFATID